MRTAPSRHLGLGLATVALALAIPTHADSTDARCDIYAKGADHTDVILPCRFYQAQGHVVITRSDGVEHDLTPSGDTPGNFTDQNGAAVYRQGDLGDEGLIFRFPEESVFVYWDTSVIEPDRERPPYEPAGDLDFDATAWAACRKLSEAEFGQCPAGVLRMGNGEGSVVIENPPGVTFTINFMRDYVNATNREVDATLKGDVWTVIVDGEDVYQIPRSLIEGG